jgi:hypothetical protein
MSLPPVDLQIKSDFQTKGYMHYKNLIPSDLIDGLIDATDKVLTNPQYRYDLHSIDQNRTVHKVLYAFEKDERFLKMLVNHNILKIVLSLIENPREIVPTWEDVLIKVPHEGIPVTFHQDLALQSAKHDVFSVAIYLHASNSNPVYYLPASHHYGPLTKNKLYEISESRIKEFVPVIADPGDVVVHNVKTIHYSEKNTSPLARYTWYLEFRTLTQLFNDSPWDKDWILGRRAIFAHAVEKYAPEYYAELIPDNEVLQPYLKNIKLRIPHLTDTVQYDMESPYNHFA